MIMIITTIHSLVMWACEGHEKNLLIYTTPVSSKKNRIPLKDNKGLY